MTRHLVLLALPMLFGCASSGVSDSAALHDGLQHEANCYGISSVGHAKLDLKEIEEHLDNSVAGFVVKKEGISWTARIRSKLTMNGLLYTEIKKIDTYLEDGHLMVRFHFHSDERGIMFIRFADALAAKRAANALWYLCAKSQGLPTEPADAEAAGSDPGGDDASSSDPD